MQTIVADNVVRVYPAGHGVCGVSLSVSAGQCLGVLGANGSGKTTLTRLVAGLDRPDSGRVSVLGEAAAPRPRRLRRRCGAALDTAAHWDTLSGRQNLWFFARQQGLGGFVLSRRVDELLAMADLTTQADEPVESWSFGMRRKLGILEAICHEPDVLILDEPSAGVDAAFLERLTEHLGDRCSRGKTTWIADNDADWLATAATDAILLCGGHLTAAGRVADLIAAAPASHQIDILLEDAGFDAIPTINGVHSFDCTATRITARVDGDPSLPAELIGWIVACGGRVRTMEVRSITLSEALRQRGENRS